MHYTEDQTEAVLSAIGLDIRQEAGDNWIVFCPYHDNWRTPAGEVSKDSGVFYCFSCSTTVSLEELVMKVSGRTFFEAMRLIKSKETESDLVKDISKTLVVEDLVEFDLDLIDRLHNAAVDNERPSNYLVYRNITESSVTKFKIGYSTNQDMITVPVHNPEGIALGFVGRSVEGKRFKNSTGLKKSKTLFNIHRVKASPFVFVVESSFDAIRLDQYGIPAVATLGAGLSKHQCAILDKYFSTIYFIPDADNAGVEMNTKMHKKLGSKVTTINLPTGVKDVGDLSGKQMKKLRTLLDNPLVGVL